METSARQNDQRDGEYVIYQGHPSWRGILSFYIKGTAVALVAGALTALVTRIANDHVQWGWVALVFAVVLGLAVLVGLIKRIATTYTVTSRRLTIREGILSKRTKETRLERVQNVNTDQSPVDRLLRVGKVDFDTAGSDDYEFAFVGISDPEGIARRVDHAAHEERAMLRDGL
jgi:uncharacterized membrane protein YdbT with pleckstrin-like domain